MSKKAWAAFSESLSQKMKDIVQSTQLSKDQDPSTLQSALGDLKGCVIYKTYHRMLLKSSYIKQWFRSFKERCCRDSTPEVVEKAYQF